MKHGSLLLILSIVVVLPLNAIEPPTHFNFEHLASTPILEGGRYKPLESFAGKTIETITGRWRFEGNDPMSYLVSMLAFPEEWIDTEIILLDHQPLKEMLGLDPSQRHFSYTTLMSSPELERLHSRIGQKMQMDQDLSPLENKVGTLLHQINAFRSFLSGEAVAVVPPPPGSEEGAAWLSIVQPFAYPAQQRAEIQGTFRQLITTIRNSDAESFQRVSAQLKAQLASLNPEIYPSTTNIQREIQYNHFRPFLKSWICYLLAFLTFLISFSFPNKKIIWSAFALFLLGYAFNTYGLLVRSFIAGRPPVSNMYESVVFVGWGIITFSLIFEVIYRQRWFVTAASVLGVGLIVIADLMPFDANIETLVPVLRSNYWLIIHVMMITLSYSVFALAMGLAHVVLGLYFFASHRKPLLRTLSNFLYRVLQVGVVMLAGGTILGGVWAAESWGRFWGWDPKETWALISLLGYLSILHARFVGWLKSIGMAVCSILGFWLIVMTWYGVNFVLGKGLHSYGFGAGGGWYVASFLILETLFLSVFAKCIEGQITCKGNALKYCSFSCHCSIVFSKARGQLSQVFW